MLVSNRSEPHADSRTGDLSLCTQTRHGHTRGVTGGAFTFPVTFFRIIGENDKKIFFVFAFIELETV